MPMGKSDWKVRWKHRVKPTRLPGVFKMQEGGHIVRARVIDPTTGRMKELKKVLAQSSAEEAFAWLEAERSKVRAGTVLARPQKVRFADYAISVFERKVRTGELKSAATQSKWRDILVHLVRGTHDAEGELAVAGFGELFVDQIQAAHVDRWKELMGGLVQAGQYSPNTVNSWLGVLRVVLKAGAREFNLERVATDGVANFDASSHVTYSEEAPNALTPEQVPVFLAALKEMFPQHYGMAFLGLATGLRPSSLRPLRRKGEQADLLLDAGKLLVRRSQTIGETVLNTTKQKTRYAIELPPSVVDVMRWHIETQLETPEQQGSDLLFPAVTGGFRAPTVLNKPFATVSEAIELGYALTQRGMRRTFNDLMRAAQVEAIVTRSISGHLTERMQDHYSTVSGAEQRASIAKVIDLMTPRKRQHAAA
jgi:integrase